MIYVTNTPNYAGVAVHGDFMDFEELYDALHSIVGEEEEYASYGTARTRVLGVCYDIRHALMGNREVEFVDNGMTEEKMKRLSLITNNKNVYLAFKVLWPEMLFVTMALNDFILLNQRKHKHSQWDKSTAVVRKLQAAVSGCIKHTVSDASYKRVMNMMNREYTWFDNYLTQYLDILNSRFLELDKEKRLKNISITVKQLAEKEQEYKEVEREVVEAARAHNCPVDNIELQLEFPEDIEW